MNVKEAVCMLRMIPRRRLEALHGLAKDLARRRMFHRGGVGKGNVISKSNHAAFLIDDRGGGKMLPMIYGENNYRGRNYVSHHAEAVIVRQAQNARLPRYKTYSLLVIKTSNSKQKFSDSSCCIRCQVALMQNSHIRVNRVYYSSSSGGIMMSKMHEMKPYMTLYDRLRERVAQRLGNRWSQLVGCEKMDASDFKVGNETGCPHSHISSHGVVQRDDNCHCDEENEGEEDIDSEKLYQWGDAGD